MRRSEYGTNRNVMYTKRKTKGNDLEGKMEKIGKAESVGDVGVEKECRSWSEKPERDRSGLGVTECNSISLFGPNP